MLKGTRLGDIEIPDDKIITFPYGLLGFEEMKRYILLTPNPSIPFRWLQSVDNPALAFVVINPLIFHPEYNMQIPARQLAAIGAKQVSDIAVLVIVTVPENPEEMTANMAGPLLINTENRLGVQAVLGDEEYSTEHFIAHELRGLQGPHPHPVKDTLEQLAARY